MLPNFVIAGNPRSGTTSLFHYLKQHPDIAFPSVKEPRYFSSIDLVMPLGGPSDHTQFQNVVFTLEDYKALFAGLPNRKRIGDASIQYFYSHEKTAPRIRETLGDVPILIMLRNPIERALSAYNLKIRDGFETESFERAIELEKERMAANYDMLWAYATNGLYSAPLKTYQATFTHVKAIVFEDFMKNPKENIREVFEFLGIDPNVEVDTSEKYAHAGAPKNKFFSLLTSNKSATTQKIRNFVMSLVPRRVLEAMAAKMFEKQDMKPETRKKLQDFFRQDIQILEKMLNKDLSHWK